MLNATTNIADLLAANEIKLPTTTDEMWRYSRIDSIEFDSLRTHTQGSSKQVTEPAWLSAIERAATVQVVNSEVVHSESLDAAVALRLTPNRDSNNDDDNAFVFEQSTDGIDALGQLLRNESVTISVAERAQIALPIVVHHHLSSGEFTSSCVQIDVKAGAHCTILEIFTSTDEMMAYIPTTEIYVGAGAVVRHIGVQMLGAEAVQFARVSSKVDEGASFDSLNICVGGSYARLVTDCVLAQRRATAKLDALYFADKEQMHDFRTRQYHRAPKTESNLLFKGAVLDHAHSVYSGLIRIDKGAKGTKAYQTNRNLVLSEGAHADSVPNLEIEENDVACSHASAVGPIDPDQLFYLEARGVPTESAQRLIVLGFFNELLDRIAVPALTTELRSIVARKLNSVEDVR